MSFEQQGYNLYPCSNNSGVFSILVTLVRVARTVVATNFLSLIDSEGRILASLKPEKLHKFYIGITKGRI